MASYTVGLKQPLSLCKDVVNGSMSQRLIKLPLTSGGPPVSEI